MDTTSHDFTWEVFTFGSKGSSILNDVFIINENDIWAVGEIYTEDTYTYDSLGNWIEPYNAVHWDGSEWELKRIYTMTSFGTLNWIVLNAIYGFSENDIWVFSNAGGYGHWNGNEWESQYISQRVGGINKIWGSSSSDIYFVGSNGNITYYNGQTWRRIESGTGNNLHDIWGMYDELTNEKTILITARNKILKITNKNRVGEFDWPYNQNSILSIWFKNMYKKFACGDGVFEYSKTNGWEMFTGLPNYKTYHIRGNDINDIFAVGAFGFVTHYNGINWKDIFPSQNIRFISLSVTDNLMVDVGYDFSSSPVKATILIIRRI